MNERAIAGSPRRSDPRSQTPIAPRVPRAYAVPPITIVVGRNLRRLRAERGLSLEALARSSGVSRAMLGQVELGKTTPSIHVAWKIARALGVTFSILVDGIAETRPTLLRASTAKCMTSNGGSITTRALSTLGTRSAVAFYELRIGARSTQKAEPHAPGTRENVVVLQGTLGIRIASETHRLTPGDAIEFQADVAHDYCNEDDEVLLLYVVMTRSADCGTALSDFAHP